MSASASARPAPSRNSRPYVSRPAAQVDGIFAGAAGRPGGGSPTTPPRTEPAGPEYAGTPSGFKIELTYAGSGRPDATGAGSATGAADVEAEAEGAACVGGVRRHPSAPRGRASASRSVARVARAS